MATMPHRINTAIDTINSIYDQADIIRIYLNNFEEIPREFIKDKIEVVIHEKDLRSSGKLYWAMNPDEYYFCVDDDLIYPPTYAVDMLNFLHKYEDKAIVSLHGRIIKNVPIKSYFKDFKLALHCLENVSVDTKVHVIGNGVSLFNTNIMTVDYKKFEYNHMDDIMVSRIAQKLKIPAIVMKHTNQYLKYNEPNGMTLFSEFHNNDSTQTKIMNEIQWKIY